MTTPETCQHFGDTFLKALRMRQPALIEPILAPNVVWSMPGESRISGEALGPEAVLARARAIGSVGMQLELKHMLIGYRGVALSLHNTATHNGKTFDMHLVTALRISGSQIVRIDTYMHDIPHINDFFAPE